MEKGNGKFGGANIKAGHIYLIKARNGKIWKVFIQSIKKSTSDEGEMVQSTFNIKIKYQQYLNKSYAIIRD